MWIPWLLTNVISRQSSRLVHYLGWIWWVFILTKSLCRMISRQSTEIRGSVVGFGSFRWVIGSSIIDCVFFQERPPPVPPSRPYTVTGNKKIAFPQNRVMRATFPGNSLNQYTWVCWVYKTNSNQTFLLAPSRRDRSFRSPFIERGDRGGDRFISSPEGLPRGGEKEPHPPRTSHTPRAQVITPLSTQW